MKILISKGQTNVANDFAPAFYLDEYRLNRCTLFAAADSAVANQNCMTNQATT